MGKGLKVCSANHGCIGAKSRKTCHSQGVVATLRECRARDQYHKMYILKELLWVRGETISLAQDYKGETAKEASTEGRGERRWPQSRGERSGGLHRRPRRLRWPVTRSGGLHRSPRRIRCHSHGERDQEATGISKRKANRLGKTSQRGRHGFCFGKVGRQRLLSH